ncbi:hypothetical protein [Psychrobacter sp. ANT_WB68]|uniref:hypothetical protein n=1 Tax=Psychrobacter sp. ANT_WB68 TaxID=2597355 RepID=UPI0011F30530|nr:hypothetical protein [Psychrobacter sp. ANT_WB68]KAA0912809.1 hypothetical protein FQ084_12435 [Psychrobacter sp. ANT_WB68]
MQDSPSFTELHNIIEYAESNVDTILKIDERLSFYLRALEVSTKINMLGMHQISTGYPNEIKNLLAKAVQVEAAIFYTCIACDYGFTYSQPRVIDFHEARLFVTRFFIENYKTMDRFSLCEQLYFTNQDKNFLAVLAENKNTVFHPVIIFKALYTSILAQLYALADREDDALSSLMNASFFYGAEIQSSMPITEQQAQNLIDFDISKRTQKANEARWQGHVERLRRKYLELDESRQGSADKKPTIKAVAQWIYEHHNEQELELETIRDHLSKARRGIFTND